MKALIDADSIVYKYASIYQDTCIWDDSDEDNVIATVETDFETAKQELDGFIEGIKDITDTDDVVLVLSPKRTFRYDVSEDYKGNRKPPKVPLEMLIPLREYLFEKGAIEFDNIEADDVCVSRMYKEPGEYVLCHIDKDLNQAVGEHYNYNTQEKYYIDQEIADYWFYAQVLEGDSVDGIKGCPRIGKVRAVKILSAVKPEEYWDTVKSEYEKAGKDEEYLLTQARLVYMLRDYNEETGSFTLWTPELMEK
jgi:DNA polymerase-1